MSTSSIPLVRRGLAALALGIGLLGPAAQAVAADKVRLAQNLSPISGVVIVAKQKGFFDQAGLDVTVVNFTSGKQALEATLGGGADIATTAEAPVTAATMARQPIAFLARMEYSYLKTLVTTKSGIESAADLKGKRLGMTVGTGSEVYTMALLEKAGMTTKDVSTVSLRPQDMTAALSANGVDAINTWEPHISNAKKALGDKVKEIDTKGVYAETFNIVTTRDYLEANPGTIQKFVKAMLEAEAWMKANREDAIATVATTVGMAPADLAPVWDEYVYGVALDDMTLDVLKKHASWRLATGNAPAGATMPDFGAVIFADALKAVAPERVAFTKP